LAEVAALAGIDCVWTDMEHVPNDWSTVERQIMAAKIHDVDVIVRVARGSYSDYIRPLEMDATGIMIPHVMSVEDAQSIIRQSRFYPLGLRPVDGGNADGGYTNLDLLSYFQQANEQRMVIFQIEDPEPLAELEQIAALPGVDMLFFGPGDFSQAIGAPGEWSHPRIIEARKQVAEVARAYGKFAGTVGSPADCESLLRMGYRFINLGSDVRGVSQLFRQWVTQASQSHISFTTE
jgi:4-hydroxy-2-oxoheptanedioate aldolase